MPVPTELTFVEDLLVTELRRSYPEALNGAQIQEKTGVGVDDLRRVINVLEEEGRVSTEGDGWRFVDPLDFDDDVLPLPSVPVQDATTEEQGPPAPAEGPAAAPESAFEATVELTLRFGAVTAEEAVRVCQQIAGVAARMVTGATEDVEVSSRLARVTTVQVVWP